MAIENKLQFLQFINNDVNKTLEIYICNEKETQNSNKVTVYKRSISKLNEAIDELNQTEIKRICKSTNWFWDAISGVKYQTLLSRPFSQGAM